MKIKLKTGKEIDLKYGIIGIPLDITLDAFDAIRHVNDVPITQGYSDGLPTHNWTKEEKVEIAQMAISRWNSYIQMAKRDQD